MIPRERDHHPDQIEQYESRINDSILSTMNPPEEPADDLQPQEPGWPIPEES